MTSFSDFSKRFYLSALMVGYFSVGALYSSRFGFPKSIIVALFMGCLFTLGGIYEVSSRKNE